MDIIPQKRCTKCGETKPLTFEYFGRRAAEKDGFKGICKVCYKQYNRTQSQRRGYKPLNRSIVEGDKRQCNRCKKWYPNTHQYFYKIPTVKSGMDCKCVFCRRSGIREIASRSGKRDGSKGRFYVEKRNARKRNLPDTMTYEQWQGALKYFKNSCAVCGRKVGFWNTLAMDHWIPLASSDCIGTVAINIIPLCHGLGGCNNSKHNRNAQEWLITTYGKRKASKILKRIQEYFDSLK